MKQNLKTILTTTCVMLLFTTCRTLRYSNVERQTQNVGLQWEAKADTMSEHTADSVLVYVDRSDSILRILERKVHMREKLKVVRDTVVVYIRNDTIINKDVVKEQTSRSPPRWQRTLVILGLLSIALVAVKLLTILKLFKL